MKQRHSFWIYKFDKTQTRPYFQDGRVCVLGDNFATESEQKGENRIICMKAVSKPETSDTIYEIWSRIQYNLDQDKPAEHLLLKL